MDIHLEVAILDRLSSRAILAYVAVKMADGSEASTAILAGLVRAQTSVMREGLNELSVAAPGAVSKAPKNRWRCGVVKTNDGGQVLQIVDSERYRSFVDDLKKYWDYLNPEHVFAMEGRDGEAMRRLLIKHRTWTQEEWRMSLQHRKDSVVKFNHASRTEPFWKWVGRLDEYLGGPLNEYNKPAETGGKRGQAISIQEGNRAAGESFLSTVSGLQNRG